jgi:uncharacterized protein YggE
MSFEIIMRKLFRPTALCVCIVTAIGWSGFGANVAVAQLGGELTQGLSAVGSETVSVKPEKLRLIMWVKAQGDSAKAAVVSLAKHRDKVRSELETMKAVPASIVFSATRVSEGDGADSGDQNAMMRMQMRSMQQGGSGDEIPEMPTVYTAKCAVRAEWGLPVQEGDALAILPTTLKEQITARDLAGENNKPELSEEAQERMEEFAAMAADSFGYSYDGQNSGPQIQYVAQITPEARAQATQVAFKKAVAEVESVSKASGIEIGKLVGVSNRSSMESIMGRMSSFNSYGQIAAWPASLVPDTQNEVSSASLDELYLDVAVLVTYSIAE